VIGDGSINVYFWIPIVAPIVGGIIAAVVYDFFIRDILIARGNAPVGPPAMEEGRVARDVPPPA
jgi:glycerol uptake facilitator protein